jgi:hypothetical protein
VKIDANDVLWSSRGKDWGFRILQHPRSNCDWLEVHDTVFANSKDDERFYTRTQVRTGLTKRERCVGLRFLDPDSRCDSAGRVIPHEFIVFGQSSSAFDDHADWARTLWQMVREKYATLYPMNPKEVQEQLAMPEDETNRSSGRSSSGSENGLDPPGRFRSTDWRLMTLLMTAGLATGYVASFLVERTATKPTASAPVHAATNVIDFVPDLNLKNRMQVLLDNDGVFPDVGTRASEMVASILARSSDYAEQDVAAAFISEYTSAEIANGPNQSMHRSGGGKREMKPKSTPATR